MARSAATVTGSSEYRQSLRRQSAPRSAEYVAADRVDHHVVVRLGVLDVGEHERMVLSAGGVVLQYGVFYGPGAYHQTTLPARPRIEVGEAARRTAPLLEAPTGVIVIAE